MFNNQLIIARHAQSQHNVGLTSDLDSDLTQKGAQQAEILGKYLRNYLGPWYRENKNDRPPSEWKIYSSPYLRAWRTASIVANELELSVTDDIEIEPRLGEIRRREAGFDRDEETIGQVYTRIKRCLQDLTMSKHNTIIFTHGTPFLFIRNHLLGLSLDIARWAEPSKVNNCETMVFTL